MDGSTYPNLSACICGILAHESVGSGEIVVRFLDVSPTGDFGHGVGLRAIVEPFWAHARHVEEGQEVGGTSSQKSVYRPAPIIVMGLAPTPGMAASRMASGDRHLLTLLEWPGVAYMQYGFTRAQLIATARRVVEGAKAPLPFGLLPKPDDVLRVTSEIRHWLDNRRINVTGMLNDFRSALRGNEISPFHLDPQPAVSEDHRKMVDRLWAYESLAVDLAPTTGGIVPLRAAMDEFEQAWSAFEVTRAIYRREIESVGTGKDHVESVVNQLEKVVEAVCEAIEATRTLDAALQKKG